jgi:hypothetical protein
MALLPFELEVAVNRDIEGIEEPSRTNIRIIDNVKNRGLTITDRRSPNRQEDYARGEGMLDIPPLTLHSTWHRHLLDHGPDRLALGPSGSATS